MIHYYRSVLRIFIIVSGTLFCKAAQADQSGHYVTNSLEKISQHCYSLKEKKFSIQRLEGCSNQVYLITNISPPYQKYVLRIPLGKKFIFYLNNPGHVEAYNNDMINSLGIGSEIIYFDNSTNAFLFNYIENIKTLKECDFENIEILENAVNILKRLHKSELKLYNRKRLFLEINVMSTIIESHYKNSLPKHFKSITGKLKEIKEIYENLEITFVPCHNDPNPSNFLQTIDGLKLIDWEYSGNNDPAWDLAYLSLTAGLNEQFDQQMFKIYDENEDEFLYERFVVTKALIQFWRFLWLRYQLIIENKALSEKEFIKFSNERFKSCEEIIDSQDFKVAYEKLSNYNKKL